MNIRLESTKKILLSAAIGAAVTFGALHLTSEEKFQRQQIIVLETRVEGLEKLLAQKEQELSGTPHFMPGTFSSKTSAAVKNPSAKASTATTRKEADGAVQDNQEMAAASPNTDQVLKDLMTQFIGDPRSFSERVNEFVASNASKENIAIASTSVFTLANNSDLLPDDSLQTLYLDQANPDLKRVVAQVASMRGDNSLIDMQIAETQARLKSGSAEERQKALVELGKTRYAGAVNAIAPLLQDKDIGVKLDALLALRATGNQSHIRLVEGMVNDPNDSVSWLANDVIKNLQNLSDKARTTLASNDIEAELPPIAMP